MTSIKKVQDQNSTIFTLDDIINSTTNLLDSSVSGFCRGYINFKPNTCIVLKDQIIGSRLKLPYGKCESNADKLLIQFMTLDNETMDKTTLDDETKKNCMINNSKLFEAFSILDKWLTEIAGSETTTKIVKPIKNTLNKQIIRIKFERKQNDATKEFLGFSVKRNNDKRIEDVLSNVTVDVNYLSRVDLILNLTSICTFKAHTLMCKTSAINYKPNTKPILEQPSIDDF